MSTESGVRVFAGAFILMSLALGAPVSPMFHSLHWLWITVLVGGNLFQSGFTGFCPLERILERFAH